MSTQPNNSIIWKEYARVLFLKTRRWERDNLGQNGKDYLFNMRKARKAITAAMLISAGYGWYTILFVLDERESFKIEVEQKFKVWNDKQSKVQ